jgi:hypothetical protein
MRLTVGWHAGPHERFAEDVRGPELGSRIRFNGVEDAADVVAWMSEWMPQGCG